MGKPFWAALIAAATGLVVGVHEWSYRDGHPYAPGPSGYIAALGFGVLLLGAAVAYIAYVLFARDGQ